MSSLRNTFHICVVYSRAFCVTAIQTWSMSLSWWACVTAIQTWSMSLSWWACVTHFQTWSECSQFWPLGPVGKSHWWKYIFGNFSKSGAEMMTDFFVFWSKFLWKLGWTAEKPRFKGLAAKIRPKSTESHHWPTSHFANIICIGSWMRIALDYLHPTGLTLH